MPKKFLTILALILLTCSTCAAQESKFDMLATTGSESSDATLTLIKMKHDGELYFVTADPSSKSVAFVHYEPKIYNFYLNRDEYGEFPPLMFVMSFFDKTRDGSDSALGVWKDDLHMLPIYALFDVQDGQIIFDAPKFYSAQDTLQPSHYHSDVTEPIHIRHIEIFMRLMPELHRQVQAKGIVLP